MNFVIEVLKAFTTIIISLIKAFFGIFIDITSIPTSFYELIQCLVKIDYTIFGSVILTKMVLFIVPLIISLIVTGIISKLTKNKMVLSICEIVLYLGFLLLMPYILSIALVLIIVLCIILLVKNNNYSYR